MAMFLAEISFLLALALVAAGLVLWHRGREATAGPVRAAGAILVVGAVLTALCTGYFSVRYHVQGDFDHAYPLSAAAADCAMMGCPHHRGRGMGPGRMGPGMMGGGMMQPGMPMPGGAPADSGNPAEASPEHDEHHPEGEE